ncbi:MAG: hypothetical protein RBG13Loki_4128 [Promethearchaeota archaeon CR_4]|nr:MAG: hypothetical protein RBG13Loki_4128 [Candidatus Lokiarchaeota archaeon CR_4]
MKCLNCHAELPISDDVVVIACPTCGWTTIMDTAFPLDQNPAVVKTGPHPDDSERKIYCYSPISKKIIEQARVGRNVEVAILKFLTYGIDGVAYEEQELLHDLVGHDPNTLRKEAETFQAKARLIEILQDRWKQAQEKKK